jgi:hypothetical protein
MQQPERTADPRELGCNLPRHTGIATTEYHRRNEL